jgi:imidazolonepropionase-like amidohydrolase
MVIVRGERILDVGPASSVRVPAGATRLELTGYTLLPGFTTVREAGSTDFVDAVVRDAINRGLIPGPRIHASGPALGSTGGHADVNGWSPFLAVPGTGAIVDGPDAVRKQVRTNVKYGADQIKIVATGGILSVGDAVGAAQFSMDELTAVVSEATRLGRRVMAHAHAGDGLKAAVLASVASIEHGSLVDDQAIALMKEKGTYLVTTLIILGEIVTDGARGLRDEGGRHREAARVTAAPRMPRG